MTHAIYILQRELKGLTETQDMAVSHHVIENLQRKIEDTTAAIEVLMQHQAG
jgi:hypothetical protein